MLKKLLAVSAGLLFTLTVFAATVQTVEWAEQHPDRYIVRKGDTLWDISARFLKKPWLWPEIWQDNPQVRNPHLIYPGDELVAFRRPRAPRRGLDRAARAHHLAGRCGQADSAVGAEAVPRSRRASSARMSSSTRRTSSASKRTSCAAPPASSPTCAASSRSRASSSRSSRPAGRYYDMPPRGEGQPREVYRQTSDWFDGRPGMLWHARPERIHAARQRALPRLRSARLRHGRGHARRRSVVGADHLFGFRSAPGRPRAADRRRAVRRPVRPACAGAACRTTCAWSRSPMRCTRSVRARSSRCRAAREDGVENGQTFSIYQDGEEVARRHRLSRRQREAFLPSGRRARRRCRRSSSAT